MTGLWTPPSARSYRAPRVTREHYQNMLAWEAEVLAALHWEGGILDHWNRELKDIDPLLRLTQAGLTVSVMGVLPGFYHLVRLRDPSNATMMMLTPLQGPGGVFVEPSDAMLRGLRAADLQNRRAVDDRLRRDQETARAKASEEARDDDDRRSEISQRLDAIMRTQVSMNTDVPWSQNHAGGRRPTRGKGGSGAS